MIKKLNIVLAVVFVLLCGLKGLKEIKVARERDAAEAPAPVRVEQPGAAFAPNVYYEHWSYFAAEDPISNRNGILLDTIRALFPKARFKMLPGGAEDFARKLREEPNAIVVGFGDHPAFAGCRAAATPMAWGKIILMTLRSNPWRYEGEESLDRVRIVTDPVYLDYAVLRERHKKLGDDSPLLRVAPPGTTQMEMAAMVEAGEADAFVAGGDSGNKGVAVDTMSMRLLQRFRKSDEIGRGDALLYVSALDPEFEKGVLDAYEKGMRRIEASGERRRIFEYYGMVAAPLPPLPEEEGTP